MATRPTLLIAATLLLFHTAQSVEWNALSCPTPSSPFSKDCTQSSVSSTSDAVVTIMLQTESSDSSSITCRDVADSSIIYCHRQWPGTDQGGVGSCFFLLAASRSFQCSSNSSSSSGGNVDIIDSSYSLLAGKAIANTYTQASCPSTSSSTSSACSMPNTGMTDQWVQAAFETVISNNTGTIASNFNCSLVASSSSSTSVTLPSTPTICSFSAPDPSSTMNGGSLIGASCGFIVPAGTTLSCSFQQTGAAFPITMLSVVKTNLSIITTTTTTTMTPSSLSSSSSSYMPPGTLPLPGTCPPSTYPNTDMCDCSSTGASNTTTTPSSFSSSAAVDADLFMVINGVAADNNFSSFHCYTDGVNVCAFGVDTSNLGLGTSCSFLLPQGQTFTCTMEWGALSFFSTAVLGPSTKSLWPVSSPSNSSSSSAFLRHQSPNSRSSSSSSSNPLQHVKSISYKKWTLSPQAQISLRPLFEAWKQEHGIVYATQNEETLRFSNFAVHVALVEDTIRKGQIKGRPFVDPVTQKPQRFNRFADWSQDEFEQYYHIGKVAKREGRVRNRHTQQQQQASSLHPLQHRLLHQAPFLSTNNTMVASLPLSINWTALGAVTAVKDQGQCGSCWSFSTTGVIEGAWAIANQSLISLSEQALVSCDTNDGCDGCDGGWPYLAIDWTSNQGAYTEESYPYVSGSGTAPSCSIPTTSSSSSSSSSLSHLRKSSLKTIPVKAQTNVTGYYQIGSSQNTSSENELELQAYVATYGPISISLDAMTQLWWTYVGGIMTGCCDSDVDHAVLVTGYGHDEATNLEYWIIKNSWSSTWGENGFVRLERGSNQCDITYEPVIAAVSGGKLPPPPPSPKPYPPWGCPFDSVVRNISSSADMAVRGSGSGDDGRGGGDGSGTITTQCLWFNNTFGMIMPPPSVIGEYCDYISDGYVGYSWPTTSAPSEAEYPCSPSMSASGDGGAVWFCTLETNSNYVVIPKGAKALCANLTDGVIGYEWTSSSR